MDDVNRIKCSPNGPYLLKGPLEVIDAKGHTTVIAPGKAAALCRCGASANKPFCDGSHSRIGFADGTSASGNRAD